MTEGKIYIELDNYQLNFQAGQIVKGKIHVDYSDAGEKFNFSCTNLELRFLGREHTNAHIQHSRRVGKRTEYYWLWHPRDVSFIDTNYTICSDLSQGRESD